MLKNMLIVVGMVFGLFQHAHGAIKTEVVEYTHNGETMEGFMAYDDAQKSPRPGVMIVHDWMGLSSFTKDKAEKLAKEGYVAYPGAVHAFTNPAVGHDNTKGAAYNAKADQQSWQEFEKFLKQLF